MVRIKFDIGQLTSGFIIPLLVLVIAVGGYWVLLPKYKEFKQQKQAFASKQNDVAGKEAQLTSVQDLISDWNRKKDALSILDDSLPDAPRVPELLANLEALSKNSGLLGANLQITMPQVSKAETGQDLSAFKEPQGILGSTKNIAVLQIDLILKGKYQNVKAFLSNLEQNLRLMDVLSLTFTPVEKETQSQEFALKIQTYYYKPTP